MYFELNDNENITCQNLWNAGNVVYREKFIVLMLIFGDKKA